MGAWEMARFVTGSRRRAWAAVLMASLTLAGCVGSGSMVPPRSVGRTAAAAPPPPPQVEEIDPGAPVGSITPTPPVASAPLGAPGGTTVGNGPVRVALILPLTGQGQSAVAAQSLKNAADLALAEAQGADITLLVKDDRGTPEGAREAASQAVAEGAELILGPLFAGSVQAAGQVARQAGKPVVAFSTDTAVAGPGVYLLSFLVQAEVDRIVAYAAQQGRRSVAALVPETTYGRVAEAQFQQAAARHGLRVVDVERYPAGQPQGAVQRLGRVIAGPAPQADSVFIPENGDGLPAVAQALQMAGFDAQRVKPLGTGIWNEQRVHALPALQGGWFAAPDNRGFQAFAARYRARYNTDPIRLATLSYDAVTLAVALNRARGPQRYTEGVLTDPAGFAGADGVFRFKPDGTNDRALAVQEIRDGAAVMVSGAPRTLVASN
ncbi:amino acid/amide ABC transporter substrate-binding protein (HAAT family) [Microvirga subterranea]|uniref:Amino acid/amide ABC transporter substrate-binding protein (HAAT family) n=2 Tax=Microvirga subterranea TaxID=186651 RepID=A0A370HLW2_9HYPH|nr:amino acid/amide ABC transporter substrate-binding protein (HAAT family) [Microvirga subterranea]